MTVEAGGVVGAGHIEGRVFEAHRRNHFVVGNRIVEGVVEVITILRSEDVVEVFAVLAVGDIEAVFAFLRVFDVVSNAVFAGKVVHIAVDAVFDAHLLPQVKDGLEWLPGTEPELCQLFPVLLLRVRFVQDVVLLAAQIHREKTVLAALAVEAEGAVAAVIHVLAPAQRITVVALDTLVAERAAIHEGAVHAVFGILHEQIVETILIALGRDIQITVLLVGAVIAVVAVLAIGDCHAPVGDDVIEVIPLVEEGSVEIKVPPKRQSIPLVTMPGIRLVDRESCIWGVHRDKFLFGEVACAMIERAVIPPRHAPLHTAVGAESRRRNQLLPSIEDWRDAVIEGEISICDLKFSRALGAGGGHTG